MNIIYYTNYDIIYSGTMVSNKSIRALMGSRIHLKLATNLQEDEKCDSEVLL